MHFKVLFNIVLLCFSFLFACQPDQHSTGKMTPPGQAIVADTTQKKIIDVMVDSINAGLRRIGPPQKIPYQIVNPTDTIYYWIVDGNSARISIELSPPDGVIWPTFFIYKGDLVYVRYRYYTKLLPAPHAFESITYLKDGKIVYCNERWVDLPGGSAPGNLKQVQYKVSKRTAEEIESDFLPLWKTVTAYMKERNALPPGIH
jgi:hypothetical protein